MRALELSIRMMLINWISEGSSSRVLVDHDSRMFPHWTNTKFEKVELQSKGDVTNKASSHNPWSQGASPKNPSSYRTIKSNDVHTSTTSCERQATSQHDMERR